MRFINILSALAVCVVATSAQTTIVPGYTGQLGDAAIVDDNPVGVTYTATLPDSNKTTIRGSISGTATSNGTGVRFVVKFRGFPSQSLGPFIYHIHDAPIPSDGSCTGALAHLDPYKRPEKPPCDPSQPQTCQVGDLAGKHGNITGYYFSASYVDLYASTKSGIGAFFGNRSIVVHTSNTTRLTCANFTLDSSTTVPPTGTGNNLTTTPITNSSSGSGNTATPSKPASFTGAAVKTCTSVWIVMTAIISGLFIAAFSS